MVEAIMPKPVFLCSLATLVLVVSAGCGRAPGNTVIGSTPSTAPVSFTVTDAPPNGVTILSFQLAITGAVLQPGNVSLVSASNPVQVDLTQLQTGSALLGTLNVPTGDYTSLSLTFANPKLTIQNNTGLAIGTCANGAVCPLTPAINPLSVTFSSAPFPITLTQNTPAGFELDLHLNNLIQTDLSVSLNASNAVTVKQLPSTQLTSELKELEDISGTVQSVGTNQFVLKTGLGVMLTINTDSNTNFDFSGSSCTTNNFACIAAGQLLEVDLSLLGNGMFLAKKVAFEEVAGQQQVTGTIVAISSFGGTTAIQLIVHDAVPSITGISIGVPASVTIQAGATFGIDSRGFTIPGGLSFAGASDLIVGQEVRVRVAGTVVTSPAIAFPTDRLTLEPSQVTATVSLINLGAANFTLNNLPSLFTTATPTPITQIVAQTSTQTNFENLTPNALTGLAGGSRVSVEGWLFNTPAGSSPATIAARKVRGRSIGT
jgi:hypothetical protein